MLPNYLCNTPDITEFITYFSSMLLSLLSESRLRWHFLSETFWNWRPYLHQNCKGSNTAKPLLQHFSLFIELFFPQNSSRRIIVKFYLIRYASLMEQYDPPFAQVKWQMLINVTTQELQSPPSSFQRQTWFYYFSLTLLSGVFHPNN